MQKPFSKSCENNKNVILRVLQQYLQQQQTVLEIGSGTGQHACFFAGQLPHVKWQASDRQENLPGIELWRQEAALANLPQAVALDVMDSVWPFSDVQALFTANTLHIMSTEVVKVFFERLPQHLANSSRVLIYGPFNYQGCYTSESNARFDEWLQQRDAKSCIKDFEMIEDLAQKVGLQLLQDVAMPANNRMLVFKRDV